MSDDRLRVPDSMMIVVYPVRSDGPLWTLRREVGGGWYERNPTFIAKGDRLVFEVGSSVYPVAGVVAGPVVLFQVP